MGRYKEYEICKFLELYKRCECLWRSNHRHYRLKSKRNEAYLRIRDAMNLTTVLEVKQKIKSFRDTYASERNKVRRSSTIARHPSEIYRPKLRWYGLADSFLNNPERNVAVEDPQDENPNNTSNIPSQEPETMDSSLQHANPPCKIRFVKINNQYDARHQHQERQVHVPHALTYQQLSQDFRPAQTEKTINSAFHPIDKSNENNTQQTGEFYHFGMNIAMQLSTLPLVKALNIQTKIQQILCAERIAHVEGGSQLVYEEQRYMFEDSPASSSVAENLQTDFKDEIISLEDEEEDQDTKKKFMVEEEAIGSLPSSSVGNELG